MKFVCPSLSYRFEKLWLVASGAPKFAPPPKLRDGFPLWLIRVFHRIRRDLFVLDVTSTGIAPRRPRRFPLAHLRALPLRFLDRRSRVMTVALAIGFELGNETSRASCRPSSSTSRFSSARIFFLSLFQCAWNQKLDLISVRYATLNPCTLSIIESNQAHSFKRFYWSLST